MAKTRGAAGAAMTEAPREVDSQPRHGDPLEELVVEGQGAQERNAAGRQAVEQDVIEPAAQPIVSERNQPMHGAARGHRPGVNDASAATDDAIARRAYELYQARGGTHGADMDDWLQAERELRTDGEFYDGPYDEPDVPGHRPID